VPTSASGAIPKCSQKLLARQAALIALLNAISEIVPTKLAIARQMGTGMSQQHSLKGLHRLWLSHKSLLAILLLSRIGHLLGGNGVGK
jgi:hypothetical protein